MAEKVYVCSKCDTEHDSRDEVRECCAPRRKSSSHVQPMGTAPTSKSQLKGYEDALSERSRRAKRRGESKNLHGDRW